MKILMEILLAHIFIFLLLFSCKKEDCSKYTDTLSQEECNIIVDIAPTNSVWFKIKGHDPVTHDLKISKTSNRWWNLYADEIEIGDTIIKKKGELTFNIHKKDTLIVHEWRCYEN